VAQQYFGTNYANLSVNQLAQLYNAQAQTYNNITPTIFFSPSYKLNDSETAYASYQHGEKAGIAQIVNGVSTPVGTERTDAYKLGLKSDVLQHTLIANLDVFWMNVHNYQQAVEVYDAYDEQPERHRGNDLRFGDRQCAVGDLARCGIRCGLSGHSAHHHPLERRLGGCLLQGVPGLGQSK
jgi:outer membrane receptor protein involved in Fe transport